MENNMKKNPAVDDLNDQEQRRREKLAMYKEMSIDPFGQKFDVDSNAAGLKAEYDSLEPEQVEEDKEVSIAGRIVLLRKMERPLSSLFRIRLERFRSTSVRMWSEKRTTSSSS